MKKKLFMISATVAMFGMSTLNAKEVTLSCRTSGVLYDSKVVMSMDCGNMSDYECESNFKESLKRKYNTSDAHTAHNDICNKLNGSWYANNIEIKY